MNHFSSESLEKLKGVDSKLQDLAFKALALHDCKVLYGLRTQEEQLKLVQEGLSRTMNSKHLVGRAIDLTPYPIDWKDTKRFYYFAGIVLTLAKIMGIRIRWGGDWDMDNDLNDQNFMDLVHFELIDE